MRKEVKEKRNAIAYEIAVNRKSLKNVAEQFELSVGYVRNVRRLAKLNPSAFNLTEKDLSWYVPYYTRSLADRNKEITARYDQGVDPQLLAEEYGISRNALWTIISDTRTMNLNAGEAIVSLCIKVSPTARQVLSRLGVNEVEQLLDVTPRQLHKACHELRVNDAFKEIMEYIVHNLNQMYKD